MKNLFRSIWPAALAAAGLAFPSAAIAAPSCAVSATSLAFGAYDGLAKAKVTTTGTITISCNGTGTAGYTITLSPGQSGNQATRYLTNGSTQLDYQVYADPAYTQVFGDGAGGTASLTGSLDAPATGNSTFYAAIPAGQTPEPGTYSDTLLLQISY